MLNIDNAKKQSKSDSVLTSSFSFHDRNVKNRTDIESVIENIYSELIEFMETPKNVVTAIRLLIENPDLAQLVIKACENNKNSLNLSEKLTNKFDGLDPKTIEKWKPKNRGYRYKENDETPELFTLRVYGRWMKQDNTGISMRDILNIDRPLWDALYRSNRKEKPEGFYLSSSVETTSKSEGQGR